MSANFGYLIPYIRGKTRDNMDGIQSTLSSFKTVTTDQLENDYQSIKELIETFV